MSQIPYTLYLNEELDEEGRHIAWWDGYKVGHKLVEAYKGTVEYPAEGNFVESAEDLWEKFNINQPKDYRNRSMCMGDVLVFEVSPDKKLTYAAARCGWDIVKA